ncbi:hypothetical protein PHYBOEH_007154 [Phytophthora boehmeriae]|uniref:TKL protein kinase n=1 Tax=Phytophthora boehmeriae TaxID=109152 RepID=A0A8T1W9T7_9STRA|nr:hypothetical protein PHYBOEH_007154 [Phytophthora boehmeriae]
MCTVVLRRHRRKFRFLVASAALTIIGNVSALATSGPASNSDILARCQDLSSDSAVLAAPTDADLPSDVASTLSAYPNVAWNGLDDAAKVGLLWVHGYVFSGGSSNGDKAGEALVEVYTRCADGASVGIEMADAGLSFEAFTGDSSRCEAVNCGSFYQATNGKCVSNVTRSIQCAVDGASTKLPKASDTSFWSSASSASTIPYPQAYEHSVRLSDETQPLTVYSIHMRNSDSGVSCSSTLDAIIPCLRLEDVANSGSSSSNKSGYCKPTINATTVDNFLSSISSLKVTTLSDTESSDEDGDNMGLILGAGVGGGVVLVLLIFCCCCRKSRMHNTENPANSAGTTPARNQNSSGIRTPLSIISMGRRKKSGDSGSDTSSNAATNANVQTGPNRRSSWYTFGNAGHEPSNRDSMYGSAVPGRRSSMAGTYVGAGAGGKTDCPPNLRKLAMDCTQLDPDLRPSSMQVAFTLKSIIAPSLRLTSSTATTSSMSSAVSSSGLATSDQPLLRGSSGQALHRGSSGKR